MAAGSYEEKRDFFRMQIQGSVQIQRRDHGVTFNADSVDLSASGLKIIANTLVNEGENLFISIKSPNPELADFTAQASVVNVLPVEQQPEKYYISVHFTAIY